MAGVTISLSLEIKFRRDNLYQEVDAICNHFQLWESWICVSLTIMWLITIIESLWRISSLSFKECVYYFSILDLYVNSYIFILIIYSYVGQGWKTGYLFKYSLLPEVTSPERYFKKNSNNKTRTKIHIDFK